MAYNDKIWEEIKELYFTGNSVYSIAKKYGISHVAILKKAKVKGWRDALKKVTDISCNNVAIAKANSKKEITKLRKQIEIDERSLSTQDKKRADKLTDWMLNKEQLFATWERAILESSIEMVARAIKQSDDTTASQMVLRAAQIYGIMKRTHTTQLNNLNIQDNSKPLEINILPVSARPIKDD